MASLKITLHDSQQDASHIAKHTPLQGVLSGTHTPLHTIGVITRCVCHGSDKVRLSVHTMDVTRCACHEGDKVRLGQVCCVDASHLELQSSRNRLRGWK